MTTKQYPLSRQKDLVVRELGQEILVYDLKTHKAYCLNETSSLVWQACDGRKSVSEISKQLNDTVKSPITEEFVLYALKDLEKNNLLAHAGELPVSFAGLSRRQVIRRVGLASAAALPVITSIVAPPAAHAQSGGLGLNQPCTGAPDTQGNCAPGLLCCPDVLISNPNTCQPDLGGSCDVV